MIEYTSANIEKIVIHRVGNKTNGEDLYLSKNSLDISNLKVMELLFKFFLSPFTNSEYYSFTFTNDDFTLNPLYNYSTLIFENKKSFLKVSVDIAKHLYEKSIHPQIKSGDLFIVHFSEICVEDEVTEAIGIFKSEEKQAFLKVDRNQEAYAIHYEDGINIEKLDKGCLIFNTDKDSGYKICIIDKSNKTIEAQYWKDIFLQLEPYKDSFHYTKDLMNITKSYITNQLNQEFELNKADQIELLNRSVEYLKTHDTFDKIDYEKEVFKDSKIIKSFRQFDNDYRSENEIDSNDNFDISPQAVKKHARLFKSVLKLDKNFHIYIHGDRELIVPGIDKDGRKYYKIYYNNES